MVFVPVPPENHNAARNNCLRVINLTMPSVTCAIIQGSIFTNSLHRLSHCGVYDFLCFTASTPLKYEIKSINLPGIILLLRL